MSLWSRRAARRGGDADFCDEQIAKRAARIDPAKVSAWTMLVSRAAKIVNPGAKPCSYAPWDKALTTCAQSSAFRVLEDRETPYLSPSSNLMIMAADIAQPCWPEPRPDLIEFALAFLEADVMLFRSGYTKRHLIKRLQQSPLSNDQILRVDRLLRRAVTSGAGLEEFRAYCKMAAHLVEKGYADDLTDWLSAQAEGAILTWRWAGAETWAAFTQNPALSDREMESLWELKLFKGFKWGLVYPELTRIVPAGKHLKEPENQVRTGAFLMLRAINRRMAAQTQVQPKLSYENGGRPTKKDRRDMGLDKA